MPAARSSAGEALRSAYEWSLALPWARFWQPVRRGSAWVMARPVWAVLAVLVLAQWATVAVVAAVAQHNGPYYFTGGDATWYWTSAWVLGHGHIPQAVVSYAYPFLLAPLALIAGPSMIAGLPLAMAFNALVLWPIALLCVYGISKTIGGRGFAYVTTLVWTFFPLAAIRYFYHRYHVRYLDQNLPSSLGLTVTGDFPSLVALLVAAYFTLRALTERTLAAALMAGAATGLAATIKPANLVFLPAPIAALAVARRGRELLVFGAALLPALGGLALWKYRGLGYVPAFSHSTSALALGASTQPPALGFLGLHNYVHLNLHHLVRNMYAVREFTWSLRMLTWALVAGVIGLARRSAPIAVLIGGWLACFLFLKGTNAGVNVTDGSFFRYLAPSFPAFFLGLAAIVLLVPRFGRRLAAAGRSERFAPIGRRGWAALLGVAALALAIPVLALAAFHPLTQPRATEIPALDQYTPVNVFSLAATPVPGGRVRLSWPSQSRRGARVSYAIFRLPADALACPPRAHAAAACTFYTDRLNSHVIPTGWTRQTSAKDHPGAGKWVYRVAVTVEPDASLRGDYILLSRPVTVDVSR
jgi:hypothetical protein